MKNVVETTILQDGAFEVHGTLPNVNPDLTSLQLVSDFSCNLGQVVVRDRCGMYDPPMDFLFIFFCTVFSGL